MRCLSIRSEDTCARDRQGHLPRCFNGLRPHRRGSGGSGGRDDYQPDAHSGSTIGLDGGEDRGNRWQHYQLIPSLMEYVLVSQTHPRVESYRRLPSGTWEYRDTTEGTTQLLSGATLDMATLYGELPV